MRNIFLCAIVATLLATGASVFAQQAQPPAPAIPQGTVTLHFNGDVALDKAVGQPGVPVKARFSDVVKDPASSRNLQEVDIVGIMAVSSESGIQAGATLRPSQIRRFNSRVVWSAVALQKPADNINRREELPSPLQSTFGVDATRVPSGTAVQASGDIQGAIVAAMKLFDRKEENEEEKTAPKQDQGQASQRSPTQAASPARSNDIASQFSPATPTVVQESAEPIVGTTSEGCPPRVDLANDMVTIQSRLTSNGVPQGACSDTSETMTLKRSFTGCADEVDKPALTAHPTFKRYYVDAGGTTQYVDADCQPDAEQTFTLSEDKGACTVDVNLQTNTASVRTQMVYQNRSNQRIVVEDCRVAAGAVTADIVTTDQGCSLRHDYQGGASHQQKRKTYDLESLTYTVEPCSDTGVSYAHTKVTNVCQVVTDFDANKAFKQYRTQIDVNGVTQFINDCTPDPDQSQDLQKTASGCETNFFHNIAAGQSFGAARWFHTLSGSTAYVTVCIQDDTVTYAHQEATTGYQNDDTTKISKPMTRLYFNAPTVGEVEVSGPQVRDGAPEIPYTLDRVETQATDISYTGCDRYEERADMSVYKRADNTEYSEYLGPAAPLGPINACSRQNSWALTSDAGADYNHFCTGTCNGEGGSFPCSAGGSMRFCTYTGTSTLTREDGQPVGSQNATRGTSSSVCQQAASAIGPCSAPSAGMTNPWNAELGWF